MSTWPNASFAFVTSSSGTPGFVRSPAKTAVSPSISPAACSATSPSMSLIRTFAPSLMKSSAVARPIPRADPVMIAALPSSSPNLDLLSHRLRVRNRIRGKRCPNRRIGSDQLVTCPRLRLYWAGCQGCGQFSIPRPPRRIAAVSVEEEEAMRTRFGPLVSVGSLLLGFALAAPPIAQAAGVGASVVKVGPKNGGGEPSIAVGPEGNQYVSYPSDDGMSFYRSFTGGRTWIAGGIADPSSGDTTVNVDRSGAVYQGNLDGNLQGDVWKSFDAGASWPQKGIGYDGQDASGQPFFVDRPWTDAYIPPGKTTRRARVYLEYHDFAPSQVWVNVSKDG